MKKLKIIDKQCNACGIQLNTWDARISKALDYRFPVCEKCIAKEYDMDVGTLRTYFEEVFGMRPCIGI